MYVDATMKAQARVKISAVLPCLQSKLCLALEAVGGFNRNLSTGIRV